MIGHLATSSLAVCVLLAPAAPAWSAEETAQDPESIVIHDRVEVDLRQVYATVSRLGGRRVLDLEKSDFTLTDDGVGQEVVTLDKNVPLTATLLIDGSFSMRGLRFTTALRGAGAFVEGMRAFDEAGVLVFSDRLLRVRPFSDRPAELAEDLRELELERLSEEEGGTTAIFDYLYLALLELEQRPGRRAVVLLSDGMDVQSVLTGSEVLDVARRSRSAIYWVRLTEEGVGLNARYPPNPWRDRKSASRELRQLEKAVAATGGRVITLRRLEQVEPTYREILAELHEQYAIGYSPDPARHDGSWREVRVRVSRPGLKVKTSEGYVDW